MVAFRQLVFPIFATATLLAAGAMAYLAMRSAAEADRLTMESLITNTKRLAEEKVDRVERKLIDTENVLLDLMSGVDEKAFMQRWDDYVGPSPFTKAVFLLGPKGEVLARVTTRKGKEREEFLDLMQRRIIPDLEIGRWPVGMLKHLHARYGGRFYFFSYQTRMISGKALTTVLEIDMDNVLGDIFPKIFDALRGEFRLAVLDQSGDLIYGSSFSGGEPFTREIRFPTTLYRWRLRLAPARAEEIIGAENERGGLRLGLLLFCSAILVVGLLGAGWATVKERRLGDLKTEFIANVSHELKTPLSLIRMFAELLHFGPARDEKKVKEYLSIIHRESERLAMLIENVLDFSRLERGKPSQVQRPVDVGEVAGRAVQALRPRLEREGHRLFLERGEAPMVMGDADALCLALQNLLDNAGKFADAPCEIRLKVSFAEGEVVVVVEDNGPGIPEDELPRVFERFFRGKRLGKRPVRGSGIGLALVQEIVRQHQGKVLAESEPGRGSRFTIKLPPAEARSAGGGASLSEGAT